MVFLIYSGRVRRNESRFGRYSGFSQSPLYRFRAVRKNPLRSLQRGTVVPHGARACGRVWRQPNRDTQSDGHSGGAEPDFALAALPRGGAKPPGFEWRGRLRVLAARNRAPDARPLDLAEPERSRRLRADARYL